MNNTDNELFPFPKRIFLDTNTLQWIGDFGDYIWENSFSALNDRRRKKFLRFYDDLEALKYTIELNTRCSFEYIISERSLNEALCRRKLRYHNWVIDLYQYSNTIIESYKGANSPLADKERSNSFLQDKRFGYLGAKDKVLIADALYYSCDCFLTFEINLPKSADHIKTLTGLSILRPQEFWLMLNPYAALFY